MAASPEATALAQQYLAEQAILKPDYYGRLAELGDPQVVQSILDAINRGLSQTRAAEYAGLNRTTLQRWNKRAEEEPDSAYAAFAALCKTREAEFIDRQHRKLEEAADDDSRNWTARMTLLERRFPEEYGRRQDDSSAPRVVVQIGVQSGDVQVAFATSSAETQRKLAE